MQVRKLTPTLGAEIIGFKIGEACSSEQISELQQLFLNHQVLLFRDQDISFDQHITFSRHFGTLDRHDSTPDYRHPEYPELLVVTNENKPRKEIFGQQWHSDYSMTICPAKASLLHAREIPDVGGDTLFANMYAAYETLSPGMRALLDPMHAVHTVVAARHLQGLDEKILKEKLLRNPPVLHPVVRIHPETGRKALYINEMHTLNFEEMAVEESHPLLEFLYAHSTKPDFVYRHRWRKHDLLIWDNRCTMHLALTDYDQSQLRRLFRTTVTGEPIGEYA